MRNKFLSRNSFEMFSQFFASLNIAYKRAHVVQSSQGNFVASGAGGRNAKTLFPFDDFLQNAHTFFAEHLKGARIGEGGAFGITEKLRSFLHLFEVGKHSDVIRHLQVQMNGRIKSEIR